jgi:hypothetical protein
VSHATELFGPMVSGHQVEEAVTSTLTTWMPTYLRHMETVYGFDALPDIRSVFVWPEAVPDGWPEHQLPALAVGSPGTSAEPDKDGDGDYRATFDIAVGVVVSASTKEATHKLARIYALAVRGSILQRRSLGGFARGTDWVGESYDAMDVDGKTRSLASAVVAFRVQVDETVSVTKGPAKPPYDPAGFPYAITDAQVDVESVADIP